MKRNNPDDNRIYNYVYKITNTVNGKIYIGVHRTDDIDDGYMGSGTNMKRAINKYGVESFEKEIIQCYDVYKDALNHEANIVTEEFINRKDTYNIKVGGYGTCIFSEEHKQKVSKSRKKRYKEDLKFAEMMLKAAQCSERREKLGKSISKWIKENPEKHMDRMMKINTNPEKIKKTADKHRGTKRSVEGCQNIRDGIKAALKNPEVRKRRSGRGSKYYYDPETGVSKRFQQSDTIPQAWLPGTGPRKQKKK